MAASRGANLRDCSSSILWIFIHFAVGRTMQLLNWFSTFERYKRDVYTFICACTLKVLKTVFLFGSWYQLTEDI